MAISPDGIINVLPNRGLALNILSITGVQRLCIMRQCIKYLVRWFMAIRWLTTSHALIDKEQIGTLDHIWIQVACNTRSACSDTRSRILPYKVAQ